MPDLFHLRIDIRKIQDYIFRVPKLKYMLGANSLIGELLSTELRNLMPTSFCPFEKLVPSAPFKMQENLSRSIVSSAGGHFESIFAKEEELEDFIKKASILIEHKLPGLEYAVSYRRFTASDTLEVFLDNKICNYEPIPVAKSFYDLPYFHLCDKDGESVKIKEFKTGLPYHQMELQADKFYVLKTNDSISVLLSDMGVKENELAGDLKELARLGKSLKRNMLAYLKIDGNGTGDRFRTIKENLMDKPVLEAFVEMEKFWSENRATLSKALKETLCSDIISKSVSTKLPYLVLMLGGDDMFLVCLPELALDIAVSMTKNSMSPVSVGIAYVKESYPIMLASNLAESCLSSAKAGSYGTDKKDPFIDWHIHFDSVYQDISDIRKASYMLQYDDNGTDIREILTKRPYSPSDTCNILNVVKHTAKELDKPESEAHNNKIKSYRSVLKNGYREVQHFRRMLLKDKDTASEFLQYIEPKEGIRVDDSLDKIELLEFYRKRADKTEVKNEKD